MTSPFASAGLPTLPVSGLDEPAVAELLRRLTGAGAHDLAARALALTGGNPLALTELCRHPDLRARLALGEPLLLREDSVRSWPAEFGRPDRMPCATSRSSRSATAILG